MPKYIACLVLATLLCSVSVEGCQNHCHWSHNARTCTNNPEGRTSFGNLGDCWGFGNGWAGCKMWFQPCMGQCLHTAPVLSQSGKICHKCYTDEATKEKICPKCNQGQVWCGGEKLCKNVTQSCDGQCSLILYPLLSEDGKTCSPCPRRDDEWGSLGVRTKWCKQSNRCYDQETEPCNGLCSSSKKWYCAATDSCIDETTPCEGKCDDNYYFCPQSNKCILQWENCGETCFGDRRYCKPRCIGNSIPCGEECPDGLTFCKLANECQGVDGHCPCPNDRWGCTLFSSTCKEYDRNHCNNTCHLKYSEPMRKPENVTEREMCGVNRPGHTYYVSIKTVGKNYVDHPNFHEGKCHEQYKLCPGTNNCIPRYQDESTGCKKL